MLQTFLLSLLLVSVWATQESCTDADACPDECVLPDCKCFGTTAGIDNTQMPQIVYLTYDDAFTATAEEKYYRALFNGTYRNPDNCPIRATHFISAQYTDYTLMNQYRNMGHELASHSITHRTNSTYWSNMNKEEWAAEFVGLRQMIGQFANVPTEEVTGIRVPFLAVGGDAQFQMMEENGFSYDCTMATQNYGYIDADIGLYPYTLDYKSYQDCPVGTCPKCSYPGTWVQPMIDLEDNWFGANPLLPDYGRPCSMLDSCIGFTEGTPEEIHDFLKRNFDRVYNGNRAPWGLYMHAAWFYGEVETAHYGGYRQFIEEITALGDVWIVPVRDGINYMKDPKTVAELEGEGEASVLGCAAYDDSYKRDCGRRPMNCRFPTVNNDDIHGGERYMKICQKTLDGLTQSCPDETRYPWLGDPCGGNDPCLQ